MADVNAGYIRLGYATGHVDLKIKSAKGLPDPEYYELWPSIANTYLDGSKDTQFQGFRRKVRIDVGVVSDRNDRIKILYWFLDNNRYIDYNYDGHAATGLLFVPQRTDGFESIWLENLSIARKFVFELDECDVRAEWPAE